MAFEDKTGSSTPPTRPEDAKVTLRLHEVGSSIVCYARTEVTVGDRGSYYSRTEQVAVVLSSQLQEGLDGYGI